MNRTLLAILGTVAILAMLPLQAVAQSGNPFAPAVIVNERPITNFEVEQRIRILRLFRTAGNLEQQALDGLIEDRLRLGAAARVGIELSPEAIDGGLAEFAGRANMDAETFLASLAGQGVAPETMRDFVKAGLAWREIIQGLYGPRASVTDAEVDRALALTSRRGGAEATLAEIILPARNEAEASESESIANEIAENVTTVGGFAAAARKYSASESGPRGGRLPRAMPLSELPPPIRAQILTLAPGQVTTPLNVPNAVAIFQLIELRETGMPEADDITLEYATYLIPGGRSEAALTEAARIAAKTDTCDDLYGINKGQSPERLTINTLPISEIPRDVGLELAKLDAGEVSTALTRGGNLAMLMLCGRTPIFEEQPDRENVRRQLVNQRLVAYGDGFLAELKADAIILYP